MQVKRFEGVDMQEVLRQVKLELGPDAVILSTRHIKKGKGAFGMFGRPMIEVTAAVDHEEEALPPLRSTSGRGMAPASPAAGRGYAQASPAIRRGSAQASQVAGHEYVRESPPAAGARDTLDMVRALDPLQRDMDHVKELLQQLAMKERYAAQVNYPSLEREFSVVKRMVEQLVQRQQDPGGPLFMPVVMPFYQRLLGSGMEESLARRLAEKVQNSLGPEKLAEERYVRGYLANILVKTVPVSGPLALTPGQCTAVAFVGPTGVGKTTTIAKLAAHYALGEKKQVALLTLDTYRIAAVEQLRTFAKIIGLSVDVVLTAAELRHALATHRDKDVVLIDTAGRSQRDVLQMAELVSFFAENQEVSVQLVLSATASATNLMETVERFKALALSGVIFTKLDEANTFGTLLSTAVRGPFPLSYFTTGQRVPEDIEVATPERVVDLILNVSHWACEDGQWQEDRLT
jgi:flagellar biosynthesis protein FlhF